MSFVADIYARLFALKSHNHVKSDITNFAHTHTKSDITDFPTIPSTPAEVGASGFPDYCNVEDVTADFADRDKYEGENSYTASENGWLDYRIKSACTLYLKYPGSTTSVKIDYATHDGTKIGTIFIKAGDTVISDGLSYLKFIPTR